MIIKISAFDTLFFKDGKPFSMGENSWADGIFPPPPTVIYGALRTAFFMQNPHLIDKAGLEDDPTNKLTIKKVLFLINDDYYVPLPHDCVKLKDNVGSKNNSNEAFKLTLIENKFISSNRNKFLFSSNKKAEVENIDDGIIPINKFFNYLTNDRDTVFFSQISDYITYEPKTGIGRNNSTRTTADNSKLYHVNMVRTEKIKKNSTPQKIDLIVEFENLELSNNGRFKFGAEGKLIHYTEYKNEQTLNLTVDNISGNILKIYLLTPAIFNNGWYPELEKNKLLTGNKFELLAATVGKPLNLGGFDMKTKTPKTMFKAVPQGAVYIFRTDKDIKDIAALINGKSISEQKANEGFGICFAGGANV